MLGFSNINYDWELICHAFYNHQPLYILLISLMPTTIIFIGRNSFVIGSICIQFIMRWFYCKEQANVYMEWYPKRFMSFKRLSWLVLRCQIAFSIFFCFQLSWITERFIRPGQTRQLVHSTTSWQQASGPSLGWCETWSRPPWGCQHTPQLASEVAQA